MENALHRLPALADADVRMLLNGPESFTPDGSFLLGEAAETKGLFLGCGMNSVGVATGGGAGMALAHCIVHGHTPTDLAEADPKRFPDCYNSAQALAARVPQVLGEHYAIHYPGYQFSTSRRLRTTTLHDLWTQHGAHFGQFFGWERPMFFNKQQEPVLTMAKPEWFDQVGTEVTHAHRSAAIFDLSSFGKIDITGVNAESFLDRVCANNMRHAPGRAVYTAMLNERGGFESDLTALRLGDEHYRLYVGTASIKRDMTWLKRHLGKDEQVNIRDVTEDFAVLGLMGPEARGIAEALNASELLGLERFRFGRSAIGDVELTGARLSYVGEDGWELTCSAADAPLLAKRLLNAGAKPAGLFAQSSMRIEKRFLSMGHDMDTDLNPLQAGLGFALDWRSNFIGREALLPLKEKTPALQILSIKFEDPNAIPLGNEPVYVDDRIVGQTTSAAFGYRVGKPVALALIDTSLLTGKLDDQEVTIDIAQQHYRGDLTQRLY